MAGIREPAAAPCLLLLWDGGKLWVLSPENRQPYSLGYSRVQREQLTGIQYAKQQFHQEGERYTSTFPANRGYILLDDHMHMPCP